MNTDVMFSSATGEWATPMNLFSTLNEEFHFGIDVCATPENAKCENFFTKKVNGLAQNWGGTEQFGAIHRMEKKSASGCRKHMKLQRAGKPLLCSCQPERIHSGSMITSMAKLQSGSSVDALNLAGANTMPRFRA